MAPRRPRALGPRRLSPGSDHNVLLTAHSPGCVLGPPVLVLVTLPGGSGRGGVFVQPPDPDIVHMLLPWKQKHQKQL